jgi:6-pyruvoyltetrahydropterin/6-carboxytetrahydropterin synthase
MFLITCTKRFDNFPFAHRQHNHDGHCAYIHGHNWSFEFEFAATRLDANGFVVDFGKLGWLKDILNHNFDHTLLLNADDPCLHQLCDLLTGRSLQVGLEQLADIRVVPNGGAEGLALYVHELVTPLLLKHTQDRVHIARVTVFEDNRNSATVRFQ